MSKEDWSPRLYVKNEDESPSLSGNERLGQAKGKFAEISEVEDFIAKKTLVYEDGTVEVLKRVGDNQKITVVTQQKGKGEEQFAKEEVVAMEQILLTAIDCFEKGDFQTWPFFTLKGFSVGSNLKSIRYVKGVENDGRYDDFDNPQWDSYYSPSSLVLWEMLSHIPGYEGVEQTVQDRNIGSYYDIWIREVKPDGYDTMGNDFDQLEDTRSCPECGDYAPHEEFTDISVCGPCWTFCIGSGHGEPGWEVWPHGTCTCDSGHFFLVLGALWPPNMADHDRSSYTYYRPPNWMNPAWWFDFCVPSCMIDVCHHELIYHGEYKILPPPGIHEIYHNTVRVWGDTFSGLENQRFTIKNDYGQSIQTVRQFGNERMDLATEDTVTACLSPWSHFAHWTIRYSGSLWYCMASAVLNDKIFYLWQEDDCNASGEVSGPEYSRWWNQVDGIVETEIPIDWGFDLNEHESKMYVTCEGVDYRVENLDGKARDITSPVQMKIFYHAGSPIYMYSCHRDYMDANWDATGGKFVYGMIVKGQHYQLVFDAKWYTSEYGSVWYYHDFDQALYISPKGQYAVEFPKIIKDNGWVGIGEYRLATETRVQVSKSYPQRRL